MQRRPFSILFIAPSRIGDAVLASGLVKVLVDKIPGAQFTFVGSELTAPLFAQTPGFERMIVMEKRPLSQHWVSLWNEVHGQKWGLVVDLRGSGLSGLLRRSKRAVHRGARAGEHKVVEAARVLKLEDDPPSPFLYTDTDTEDRAAKLTAGEGPILAIAPAANWMGKAWPAERFANVARRLLGPGGALEGGRLMLLGAWRDRDIAGSVKAAVPSKRQIDLVGVEELLVCYAALKRARLFIGNDSGVMHLAAAANVPTLGLFGPSDDELYGPWGPAARAVRGPRPFEAFLAIDPTLSHAVCHMTDLPTGEVLAAAEALIAKTAPEAVHA
ncbi:MAG TPA: glycosyltransferase family 9 protein [Caulobacteraceae bacterium]